MASIIRCDEDPGQYIAFKADTSDVGYGSQILVQETQNAILLESGQLVAKLEAGTYPIESPNLPFLNKLLPGGGQAFAYDVWFITTLLSTNYKWGTRAPVQVFDSKYQVLVPIGCHGSVGIRIKDHESFFKNSVGTSSSYSQEKLRNYILPLIEREITNVLANACKTSDVFTISNAISDLSLATCKTIKNNLRPIGLEVDDFYIQGISIIGDDPTLSEIKNALALAATIRLKSEAIRDNRDVYTLERSFNVLENASKSDSGASAAFIGAGIGLGAGSQLGTLINIKPEKPEELNSPSAAERLQNLKTLHDQGLVTQIEYEQKRKSIIEGI